MTWLVVADPEPADERRCAGHPDRVRAAIAGVDALDLGADRVDAGPRDASVAELTTSW